MNGTCNRTLFGSPPPGALRRGRKNNYHQISITKSISKIFKQNFVCSLTNKTYKHIRWDFYSVTRGGILGIPWGQGGSKNVFIRNSTRSRVLVTNMNGTCNVTTCWSPPTGALRKGQKSNIIKFQFQTQF